MNDSLSSEYSQLITPQQLQAWQLILRNKTYKVEVDRIRKAYDVGQHEIESDNYYAVDEILQKSEQDEFQRDVHALAKRVTAPGEWANVIRYHILGFSPEMLVYGADEQRKGIEIEQRDGFVEVRIYGDMTQPELRSSLKKIRAAIIEQKSVAYKPKYKPQLNKTLQIYDLSVQGWKHDEIATHINKNHEPAIVYSDIGKYVQITREQIEKIVA